MHWIGAQFCVYIILDSRDKYLNKFQNVSGFHLQDLGAFRIHMLVTLYFVSTFSLLWIPQQASITSFSGFRNCKWIPQNVSGIRKCKWSPQNL